MEMTWQNKHEFKKHTPANGRCKRCDKDRDHWIHNVNTGSGGTNPPAPGPITPADPWIGMNDDFVIAELSGYEGMEFGAYVPDYEFAQFEHVGDTPKNTHTEKEKLIPRSELPTPTTLNVLQQKVRRRADGSQVVDLILETDDIGMSQVDIRINV